jgi:hypothetical protein
MQPNVHCWVENPLADGYNDQWTALMRSSQFYDPSGSISNDAIAGSTLCVPDLLTMLSMGSTWPVSVIFIRECYISWFNIFLEGANNRPRGKFALSSIPGSMATNFIFKMAAFLFGMPILYQFKKAFYHVKSNRVYGINRERDETIARLPDTFYVVDGHNADPVESQCLTLFISSPRSDTFKHWHYDAQIVPRFPPVWSLHELRNCRNYCYPIIDMQVVARRYEHYGGYVF